MLKIILVVAVVFIYTAYAAVVTCGPNEDLDHCPSSCGDACPTRSGEFSDCGRPDRKNCPPPKCVCQFNYRRVENGTCIPVRECPAIDCPNENEVYNACPGYCPSDDCSQATWNGECPIYGFLLFVVECLPTCRCQSYYWRKDGVCVPYQQCLGKD